MNKTCFLLLIALVSSCKADYKPPKTTGGFDHLSKYIGMEVADLMKDPKVANYKYYSFADEPPFRAYGLVLLYENYGVKIYPNGFKHMEPENFDRDWDIELFKKETVRRIVVYGETDDILYDSNRAKR